MTTRPTAAIDRLSSRYYNEDAYGPENPGGLDESEDGLTAGHVTNFPDALADLGAAAGYVGDVVGGIEAVAAQVLPIAPIVTAARDQAVAAAQTAASIIQHVQPSEIAGIPPILDFVFSSSLALPAGVVQGSSGKWVTDRAGLLTSVAAGTAPIDFDPITAVVRGLLVEESRTNLLTYSRDLTQWSDSLSNTTVSADSATAPDGTLTADVLSSSASGTDRLRRKTLTVSADTTQRVFYAFWKANGGSKANLSLGYSGGTSKNTLRTFDLAAGTSALSGGSDEGSGMRQLYGGYWLCWVVLANNGTNTTATCDLRPYGHPDLSAAGSVTFGGAGCEVGSFPTSYIPTTSSTVTRAADANTLLLSSVPGWNSSEGTIYVEYSTPDAGSANDFTGIVALSDGTTSNLIDLYCVRNTRVPQARMFAGGVQQVGVSSSIASQAANAVVKVALAWKANDVALSANGAAAVTDTSATMPTVTTLLLGQSQGSPMLNGYIRRLTLFPRRLSNATLQLLTA